MRSKLVLMTIVSLILTLSVLVEPQPVFARECKPVPAWTGYQNNKPALIIQHGKTVTPPANAYLIFYRSNWGVEQVRAPSDWGVRTDAPAWEGRGITSFYIAGRWFNFKPGWIESWRWTVWICN